MPSQWEPYVDRFIAGAAARISREQLRGLAPVDRPEPQLRQLADRLSTSTV